MTDGSWTTQRDKRDLKQAAADARELLREQIRNEKRQLRDLRYCAERSTLTAAEWRDLLTLHQQHGKEGIRELWESLIPYWEACQAVNKGEVCPSDLKPAGLKLSAENTRTKPTTRNKPGAPRKPRTDKGKPRASYKPRTSSGKQAKPREAQAAR
jgi:hypothetical protein